MLSQSEINKMSLLHQALFFMEATLNLILFIRFKKGIQKMKINISKQEILSLIYNNQALREKLRQIEIHSLLIINLLIVKVILNSWKYQFFEYQKTNLPFIFEIAEKSLSSSTSDKNKIIYESLNERDKIEIYLHVILKIQQGVIISQKRRFIYAIFNFCVKER
ncbi:hypothetical protein ABPG72_004205 [Tetrahymena utriculariae]